MLPRLHHALVMARRKQPAKKQQPITLHALPLLTKPLEQIGKQINVPGSYWDGGPDVCR